jgi:hypothetical protein
VIQGNDTEFDGNLGLVIGAGGGSLTLTSTRSAARRQARQLLRDRRQPVGREGLRPGQGGPAEAGVEKIAVMMSIVSNTRVDIVARGVIKACLELGKDPARRSRSSASPAPGRRRASRSSRSTASSTATAPSRCTRRPAAPSRRSKGRGCGMSILIDENTTFIVQGITGREASTSRASAWTTARRSSAASRPAARAARSTACRSSTPSSRSSSTRRRRARRLGRHRPPAFTKDAVFEAIENGIKLIVIVTERIPRRDVAADGRAGRPAARASSAPTASG